MHFSVFSRDATRIDLLLYDDVNAQKPVRVVTLDPLSARTRHYWHVFLPEIGEGQLYAYRAHGPFEPERGLRFDCDKVLIDPYGRAVAEPAHYNRSAAERPGANDQSAMKSVVTNMGQYDWEGDEPLNRSFAKTIIYEMHVGGFTKHPSSGVKATHRGTYLGLIDKIPYLQELGITSVELLPVFQFDWQRAPDGKPNYWGYAPLSFFAPHNGYGVSTDPLVVLNEFRDMVKALHRAGIEVILDVVFGQTGEGGWGGPTLSLRGLANNVYYMMEHGGGEYANYSGTGNTLNANQSVVRRMIVDSLHYWVEEMHVDGFRFDLAAILSRDPDGKPLPRPPVLWDIASDPVLAGTKLIAEAWDAAGLYQVGSFGGEFWKEWNGQFRDDVRSFVKGDAAMVPALANRLLGSPDLYGNEPRSPEQSINFITAHDGFTLNDLVSYNYKHNEANGEDNRDGTNDNRSWNHGVEGPTEDAEIEALRNRQVKNLLAINMLSLGTPMFVMGDEIRRTQLGNNNAYCQDNELSWMDWSLVERHADVHRFMSKLIDLRLVRDTAKSDRRLTLSEVRSIAKVKLHGVRLGRPDHGDDSRSLAVSASTLSGTLHMFYMINAWVEPLEFELPPAAGTTGWRRAMDTSLPSPDDIATVETAVAVEGPLYSVGPRSVVALIAPTITV